MRREIKGPRAAGPRAATDTGEETESGPEVIRALSTWDLLVAGATSGQIGVALSVVAVASQVFDDVFSNSFAERIITSLAPRSITAALLLVLVVGLFAWLLSIAGTVLSYAGFTLARDGTFLYIRRGLLERREATIPLARIQAVKVVEGVLRQPFGLAMVRVESAGYGEDAGVSTTLFPLLPREEARELLRRTAPEFAVEPPLEKLPRRVLRRYVFRAVLPVLFLISALAAVSVLALDFIPGAFLALLLLVPAVLLGWLRYRDAGWALTGGRLVVRSRMLARTTTVAPRRRLQSRSVLRNPFQRRLGLATLRAQVASGGGGVAVEVVDLGSETARALIERLGLRAGESTGT